jgi:hypothetical protein
MVRFATLVAMVAVAFASVGTANAGVSQATQASSRIEKTTIVQRSVNHATECVIRAIENDPSSKSAELAIGELIVAVMPSCTDKMHAMIESFDDTYGAGSGEKFFSGAFLDLLPLVVNKRIGRDISAK